MSQEANPYFVTSVGSMTRIYDDHSSDNPMKQKHAHRIITMNQNKADSKAAAPGHIHPPKNRPVDKTHLPGKYSAHHSKKRGAL